jgi:hypothetical protein
MADKPKIVDVTAEKKGHDALPPTQKAIHYSGKHPDTGRDISGEFVCRRVNLGQLREISLIKARLNGGRPDESLDQAIVFLNNMLAHLQVALLKAPEWWQPDEFYNSDIISTVFEEVMAFEATFRHPTPQQLGGAAANSQS